MVTSVLRFTDRNPQEQHTALVQTPELLFAIAEFLTFDDAACFAIASVRTLRDLETASCLLSSEFTGIELFGWRTFASAMFQQLQETMRPQVLLHGHCEFSRPRCTGEVMPLSIDTSGSCFVRFGVMCSLTRGGISVGLIDAAAVQNDRACLRDPRCQTSGAFAISLDPCHGTMQVSHRRVRVRGKGKPRPSCSSADLIGWDNGIDFPGFYQGFIGMQIQHGTLEYIRPGREEWESTGVVWDKLPSKVIPCAFMSCFAGQAVIMGEVVCVNGAPLKEQSHKNIMKRTPWKACRFA